MIGTLLEKLLIVVGVDLSDLGGSLNGATADVEKAAKEMRRSFEDVGKSWQQTGQGMMKAGALMSAAITAPLVIAGKASIDGALAQRQAMAQVEATLASMGDVAGRTSKELLKASDALELNSLFDGDVILKQVTANLLTFGSVAGEQFDKAQQAAIDMATRLGGEPQAAAIMLGKALNDPIKGITALTRVGVSFSEQQQGQIKAMAEAGDVAGAQSVILAELKKQYGGAAAAAADTDPFRKNAVAMGQAGDAIGEALLPLLPPLTDAITGILQAFTSLDPGIQTFIVGAAGVAAAIGPVLLALGAIVSTMGTVIAATAPLTGAIAAAFSVGGALAGATATLGGFGGVLAVLAGAFAPVLIPLAAIAGVGALIYANWENIAPVLADFGSRIQEVLGPKLMALVEEVTAALTELWDGPFGDGLRFVIAGLGEFQSAYSSILGEVLIRVLSAAVELVTGAFALIVDAIRLVVAVLSGDFAGAWEIAKELVTGAISSILAAMDSLAPGAAKAMKLLVEGVREWIVGRLNAIWETVTAKIEAVKGAFFDLYDAVVGNSYIPDMVDEIGQNMARLQALMVNPARAATASTGEAFRNLAADVGGLLDQLFPVQAELRGILEDMATLEAGRAAGLVDPATYDAARGKLAGERNALDREARGPLPVSVASEVEPLTLALIDLSAVMVELPRMATEAEMALYELGDRLGNDLMGGIAAVLTGRGSLKDVVGNLFARFMEDTIVSALSGLEKQLFGDGGLGNFFGTFLSSVIGGRAVGGPVVPGRAYTVGSGEVFQPSQTGRILSRNDAMRAFGGGNGGPGRIAVTVNGARGNQEIMEMVRAGVAQGIGQYDTVVGGRVNSNLRRRS